MGGIVLNRMYAGSYLSSNLGHEVINMFQADNGKHYLYLNSRGNFEEKGKLVSQMLLVMHIGGKRVEVLALANNLKPVESAQCALPRNLCKKDNVISEAQRAYILGEEKNEKKEKGGIHYGGAPLLDLFGDAGQQNIFVSYEVGNADFFIPKKRLILHIEKQEGEEVVQKVTELGERGYEIRLTKHNFGSTTLHQYILEGNDDYDTLRTLIENTDPDDASCIWMPSNEKVILGTFPTRKISLFDICKIRHNENCFSDALAYYMEKYPELWAGFFRELEIPINNTFTVSREVDAKINSEKYKENTGGRIDLLLSDDKSLIVIENKVKSDINKIKRDLGVDQDQLDRYKNFIKYFINNNKVKQKQYYLFVLSPDYSKLKIDNEKEFKHLKYGQICNYLEDKVDILDDSDFKAFYYAMRRHSFEHESLCMYDDMKNIFYSRIEEYYHHMN